MSRQRHSPGALAPRSWTTLGQMIGSTLKFTTIIKRLRSAYPAQAEPSWRPSSWPWAFHDVAQAYSGGLFNLDTMFTI